MNTKTATIKDNNFVSIFADATLLFELSKSTENKHVKHALAKSSILAVNFALEAAANSFLETVDLDKESKAQADRQSTLEKFDFVLQYHIEKKIPKSGSNYSDIAKLIKARDTMVHPKVMELSSFFVTEKGEGNVAYNHYEVDSKGKRLSKKNPKARAFLENPPGFYTEHNAKAALEMFTTFMNAYVLDWWGLEYFVAETFLFKTWTGTIGPDQRLIDVNDIEVLLRNNDFLNIKFMGLYGLTTSTAEKTSP